jgi:hypothetical protein
MADVGGGEHRLWAGHLTESPWPLALITISSPQRTKCKDVLLFRYS